MELSFVARKIADQAELIRGKLTNSTTLLFDVTEDYFDKYDSNDRADRVSIAWEYRRYGIYAHVIWDILEQVVQDFDDMLRQVNNLRT